MNASSAPGTPLAHTSSVREPIVPDPHILPRARSWFRRSVAPTFAFLVAVVALLAIAGLPWPRLALVVALYVALALLQWTIIRSVRRPADVAGRTLWIMLDAVAAVGGLLVLTGGLSSPLLLLLAAPTGASAIMLRRPHHRVIAWAAVALVLAAVALVPAGWTAIPALSRVVVASLALLSLAWAFYSIHDAQSMEREVQHEMQCCLNAMQEEQVVAAENQLRRLQSVGAKVAHELKNPLASIKGLVQLVERSNEDAKAKERLAVVSTEIARMETILRDYLSYSRPLEDLHLEEVELVALIDDVRAVLSGRAEHARVDVSCQGEPLRIQGDPRRLKEALINLVANAIEATPAGGSVDVAVTREPDHARITIKDSGAGMSPDQLTRVGTSFFTTRAGGTGLGVVPAKNAVVQHGGGLRYTSKPGGGTTVTVELPLTARTAEPAPAGLG